MKKFLLVSILLTLAIVVSMPAMAGVDRNAGISLLPPIVIDARPAIIAMPADTGGVYVIADADTDMPKSGLTGRDEKQQGQPLEKGKPTESEDKPALRINVWPVQSPDNVKSGYEMKDENKHTPPDR